MRIEEAIVYVLASAGRGMKTEQIAREINEKRLFVRRNNVPVDGKMVYAVVMSHPGTFVTAGGWRLVPGGWWLVTGGWWLVRKHLIINSLIYL